jgi:NTP pyrophosphatase (non-canonical NTP hydrolase)
MARLVLLATSPAAAPGLLSWPAWELLRGAERVLAGGPGHPLLPALAEAGIGWELLPGGAAGPTAAGGAAAGGAAAGGARGTGVDGPGAGAAALARQLTAAMAGACGDTVWLCDADPPGRPVDVPPGPVALADELGGPDGPREAAVEVVYGSTAPLGGELLTLVAVMDTLRRRCPWDAEQTHESLAPYLIEEAYEALDALESGEAAKLAEELGDVLLQVMFHARVAQERSDGTGFSIDDVAGGIVTKLVRRHPHVFAGVAVSGPEDVTRNWDAIKAAERASASGSAGSALDGVPFGQPALALAAQLQRRAERAGVPPELAAGPAAGPAGGVGEELFALVARARAAGADPEAQLRATARQYAQRVRDWEQARPGSR